MSITVPTISDFWRWLMQFSYKMYSRHCSATNTLPVGVPHNRDPLSPCTGFAPRPVKLGDYIDCETDGHYLCKLCCHRKVPVDLTVRATVKQIGDYEVVVTEPFKENRDNIDKLKAKETIRDRNR